MISPTPTQCIAFVVVASVLLGAGLFSLFHDFRTALATLLLCVAGSCGLGKLIEAWLFRRRQRRAIARVQGEL